MAPGSSRRLVDEVPECRRFSKGDVIADVTAAS